MRTFVCVIQKEFKASSYWHHDYCSPVGVMVVDIIQAVQLVDLLKIQQFYVENENSFKVNRVGVRTQHLMFISLGTFSFQLHT